MVYDNDEITVENLREQYPDTFNLFSKKYFSHTLKMAKPDSDFFKFVLKDLSANSYECIFIDDKQKNVDAANEVGMKGILFTDAEKLKKELISHGVDAD